MRKTKRKKKKRGEEGGEKEDEGGSVVKFCRVLSLSMRGRRKIVVRRKGSPCSLAIFAACYHALTEKEEEKTPCTDI